MSKQVHWKTIGRSIDSCDQIIWIARFDCRIACNQSNQTIWVGMKDEITTIQLIQKLYKKIQFVQFCMQIKLTFAILQQYDCCVILFGFGMLYGCYELYFIIPQQKNKKKFTENHQKKGISRCLSCLIGI